MEKQKEYLGKVWDNAIEALENSDGVKRLWLKIVPHQKHHISIEVINTYGKVKSNEMKKFFKKGYSTKGEERGIGLYHTRDVVRKNKGEIIIMNQNIDNAISIQIVL